jgi:hypothetical protein
VSQIRTNVAYAGGDAIVAGDGVSCEGRPFKLLHQHKEGIFRSLLIKISLLNGHLTERYGVFVIVRWK